MFGFSKYKNRNDLNTYYEVGKELVLAGKHYGDGVINKYSKKLTNELGKGYSKRNLWLMLRFYNLKEKMQTVSAQLSWSHYCELLSLESISEISYYVMITEEQKLSVRQLRLKVKNEEYRRLSEETKNKLIKQEKVEVNDLVKDPIIIKNNSNYEIISEKILQRLILENLPSFLEKLGEGFIFIKNEYKLKLDDRYNYIDLLLYNIKYRCYVVVELKVTELRKEHTGQIMTYMNYIDKNIKTIDDNKTVGIIICKKDNKYIIEYCSDDRIISRIYELV